VKPYLLYRLKDVNQEVEKLAVTRAREALEVDMMLRRNPGGFSAVGLGEGLWEGPAALRCRSAAECDFVIVGVKVRVSLVMTVGGEGKEELRGGIGGALGGSFYSLYGSFWRT